MLKRFSTQLGIFNSQKYLSLIGKENYVRTLTLI